MRNVLKLAENSCITKEIVESTNMAEIYEMLMVRRALNS